MRELASRSSIDTGVPFHAQSSMNSRTMLGFDYGVLSTAMAVALFATSRATTIIRSLFAIMISVSSFAALPEPFPTTLERLFAAPQRRRRKSGF